MKEIMKTLTILFFSIFNYGCGPLESGVIDTGFLNTGGTDDPRRLITVAYNRLYYSNRVVGARNVLRRAIEQSQKRNDMYALTMSYNMMAYTYIAEQNNKENTQPKDPITAEDYYLKAQEVANKNNFQCELVHTYVGFSLISNMNGFSGKACEHKLNAENLILSIKEEMSNNKKVCEEKNEITQAESRVADLHSYLNCKNNGDSKNDFWQSEKVPKNK